MDVMVLRVAARFQATNPHPYRRTIVPHRPPRIRQDDSPKEIVQPERDAAEIDAAKAVQSVIRKEKGEYCVRSPNNPDWNGGCFDSKGEAEKRLKQVEYFKRQ